MHQNRGMTLVELLVALAIGSSILIAVADLIRVILVQTARDPVAVQTIDQARIAAGQFMSELRNATFGSDGSYPLAEASSSEIIFYTPVNGAVERVRYFLASSTLYKGTIQPTGSPLTYPPGNEQVVVVLRVASSSTPLFSYYDGSYAGSTSTAPLAAPVPVTTVRYIQLSLTAPDAIARDATTTFIIAAGATIRNLKDNLGK